MTVTATASLVPPVPVEPNVTLTITMPKEVAEVVVRVVGYQVFGGGPLREFFDAIYTGLIQVVSDDGSHSSLDYIAEAIHCKRPS